MLTSLRSDLHPDDPLKANDIECVLLSAVEVLPKLAKTIKFVTVSQGECIKYLVDDTHSLVDRWDWSHGMLKDPPPIQVSLVGLMDAGLQAPLSDRRRQNFYDDVTERINFELGDAMEDVRLELLETFEDLSRSRYEMWDALAWMRPEELRPAEWKKRRADSDLSHTPRRRAAVVVSTDHEVCNSGRTAQDWCADLNQHVDLHRQSARRTSTALECKGWKSIREDVELANMHLPPHIQAWASANNQDKILYLEGALSIVRSVADSEASEDQMIDTAWRTCIKLVRGVFAHETFQKVDEVLQRSVADVLSTLQQSSIHFNDGESEGSRTNNSDKDRVESQNAEMDDAS